MTHLEDNCENIDASVFSSDMLFDDEQRQMLKNYISRWDRAIAKHEAAELPYVRHTAHELHAEKTTVVKRYFHICAEHSESPNKTYTHHFTLMTTIDPADADFYEQLRFELSKKLSKGTPVCNLIIRSMSLIKEQAELVP